MLVISVCADVTEGKFGAERKTGRPAAKQIESSSPSTKKENKLQKYPFHGKVDSADPKAGTITLKGKARNRVILVTSDTYVTRDGRSAKLADAQPGEAVSGSVMKVDGKEKALTLRLKGEGTGSATGKSATTPAR